MNYVQIYLFFELLTSITALLYPCQYLDSSEQVFRCDRCRCSSLPSIYSTSNLCSLTPVVRCGNYSHENFLRSKLNEISSNGANSKNQIEFHHFNYDLFNHEQLCFIQNSSQLTFYNILYNQSSKCLSTILALRFVNSIIANPNFLAEKLVFYNSSFNIRSFDFSTTKILLLHSIKFSIKPFELHSLSFLTDLTITQTEDYHLTGLFSHLSFLNLRSTQLTDKQLNRIFSQVNCPDLTTLILANNHLTSITNKFPSTIRYLDLSNNQIKSLDYYSFKTLYSLNILNLSFNSPLEIQQDTFTRIPYLEILDLSHSLPTLSFDELFLPLQKLRHLNISNNLLDTLPQLPVPYDAHIIESYDHHLPVLYVDLSSNHFEKLDLEIFSTPSTQDKYILSFNLKNNRLKTLNFSAIASKRRGPFVELDITSNPFECDCSLYETIVNISYPKQMTPADFDPFTSLRYRRQHNLFQPLLLAKQSRIKFLHLSNLTCSDLLKPSTERSFFDLNSSNSFCSYKNSCPSTCFCCSEQICDCHAQCPSECTCKHSQDFNTNYVNCSNRRLHQIPSTIPSSTTHLDLTNNLIKSISYPLQSSTLEYLDLSFNQIDQIGMNTFAHLLNLKQLYLHNNPWLPHRNEEFHSNKHLILLTYANGLLCNRTTDLRRSLTIEDCCQFSNSELCQIKHAENYSITSKNNFISFIDQKYFLLALLLCLLLFSSSLIFFIYCKKRILFAKENYFSHHEIRKPRQFNDNSSSYTDEDDYASIPLTISQTDLTIPVLHSQSNAPPLPPPRYFLPNRPVSHSSTTSTSITIRSIKGPNSVSIATTRSCLQIKLDALVLYSINDSEYIHEHVGQRLEYMYGRRFSFYFIHRDRMLGELDWLIENSCITILILRKPYHLIHDYMKILSNCSTIKCFIILIHNEQNYQVTSIKVREKIAKLYRTSDIYEWNPNPNALIHEQLELFLEQNCGSATYVTD